MASDLTLYELMKARFFKQPNKNVVESKRAGILIAVKRSIEANLENNDIYEFEIRDPEVLTEVIDIISDPDIASIYNVIQKDKTCFIATHRVLEGFNE